jgi:hypothetical protein
MIARTADCRSSVSWSSAACTIALVTIGRPTTNSAIAATTTTSTNIAGPALDRLRGGRARVRLGARIGPL